MAEKCTNTSGPPSWEMKPYPFSELNHFTVPVAIMQFPFRFHGLSAGEGTAQADSNLRCSALKGARYQGISARGTIASSGAGPSEPPLLSPDATVVPLPVRLPQLPLQHLAGRVAGQHLDHVDRRRALEPG